MKYLFTIVFCLFCHYYSFCQQDFNDINIEYTVSSRGIYKKIEITENLLVIKADRKGENIDSLEVTTKKWSEIIGFVNRIEFKKMSYLKAPSEKRFYDGAGHAQLKIKYTDTIYQSSEFDHGNPPYEIKELIDYVLDFSKLEEN